VEIVVNIFTMLAAFLRSGELKIGSTVGSAKFFRSLVSERCEGWTGINYESAETRKCKNDNI